MKTWLITGCSSGLGAALAEGALTRGERVMLTARKPETLSDVVERFPETARAIALDVTDPASVKRAIASTEDVFGSLDVFVNNAASGSSARSRRCRQTNIGACSRRTSSA